MIPKEHAVKIQLLVNQLNEAIKEAEVAGLVININGLISTTNELEVSILEPVKVI